MSVFGNDNQQRTSQHQHNKAKFVERAEFLHFFLESATWRGLLWRLDVGWTHPGVLVSRHATGLSFFVSG
jgi:hypothetical protein